MGSTKKNKIVLKGHKIIGGLAEGRALVTKLPFGFTHGVDPKTGDITDVRHDLRGENLKDRILIFPYGKSSSSGALFILEMVSYGNAPAALINIATEPVISAGFIMGELIYGKKVPIIDQLKQNPTEIIKTGDYVKINGDKGIVEIIKSGQ